MRPFQLLQCGRQQATPAFNAVSLHDAIKSNHPSPQALQQAVARRMEELQLTQPLHLVHQSVNAILVQETGRHFPPQRKEDRRISANLGYRAGATRIQRAFRALKQQSKQLKAELAAVRSPTVGDVLLAGGERTLVPDCISHVQEVAWLKTKAEEANELVHRPNASMVFKVVKELTKGIPRKRTDGGTLQGMNQREVETWKEHFQTIQSGRGEVSEDVWEDMEQ
eukprot:s3671_g5.t1